MIQLIVNVLSTFRHTNSILYLEEKLLCVLIIDNCSKSGLFHSLHDYTLLCALLPQKFSTNNHTTKKGNKEEVEPILLALLSVKRELFFFLLYFTASVRP